MSRRDLRGMRRRALALCAGLLLLAGVAGCGLPSGSNPVQVPKADVPYGLLDPATSSPTPTVTPGVPLTTGSIFLADAQQRLASVEVQVPAAPLQPLVQTLLNRLAVGPSERERARGLVTDLGPGSTLVLRSVINGTAMIEWQPANQDPTPTKLPVAVGQIVLTASSVVGIDRVQFVKDGAIVQVPSPSGGNLTSEPLLSGYYSALLPSDQPPPERTVPSSGSPTPSTTSAP